MQVHGGMGMGMGGQPVPVSWYVFREMDDKKGK